MPKQPVLYFFASKGSPIHYQTLDMGKILKKVRVETKQSHALYQVVDIFDGTIFTMTLGKLALNYINLSQGTLVYLVLPETDAKEGQMVVEKYLCLHGEDVDLCQQKKAIERREEAG